MEIKIEKAKVLKDKPDFNKLGFGKFFTDYMFIAGKILKYKMREDAANKIKN